MHSPSDKGNRRNSSERKKIPLHYSTHTSEEDSSQQQSHFTFAACAPPQAPSASPRSATEQPSWQRHRVHQRVRHHSTSYEPSPLNSILRPYQGHSVPVHSVPSSQFGTYHRCSSPARARAQPAISDSFIGERAPRSRAAHRNRDAERLPRRTSRASAATRITTSRAGLGDADAQRAPQAAPPVRMIAVPHPLAAETAAHTDTDAVPMCRVQQRTTARPGGAADVPMSPASPPDTDTTTTAPERVQAIFYWTASTSVRSRRPLRIRAGVRASVYRSGDPEAQRPRRRGTSAPVKPPHIYSPPPRTEGPKTETEGHAVCRSKRNAVPAPSYAEAARAPTPPPGTSAGTPRNPSLSQATAAPPPREAKKQRVPPLIVEHLPDWVRHFRTLKGRLNSPLTRAPTEKGWFSYQLPAEKSVKVAIRGIPADTPVEEITEALAELGHCPEYVRQIKIIGPPGAFSTHN
ncbi:serine/arginine repetitive matrix protein 1-like [Galleria mellonella]|uniref:Serine/arginine repetitive matrix protein 1-like n=1 Tax=Galleria mellonella TaxID=7137 RepID=A0ABM3MTZ2_GALME|nr:serine/arginine repetitive matrix protein 1-like [Galleria mellonella]